MERFSLLGNLKMKNISYHICRRAILFIVMFLFSIVNSYSQLRFTKCEVVNNEEIGDIFNDSLKSLFNIKEPLIHAVRYREQDHIEYVIFNELKGRYFIKKDSANYIIRVVNITLDNGVFSENWILKDSVLPDFVVGEQNIKFDFDLTEFKDYDSDLLVEPVIVYSTLTHYYFCSFYRGEKRNIMLQYNGYGTRKLIIDKSFYELPEKIQEGIRKRLEILYLANPTWFPENWQESMDRKKTHVETKVKSR